VKLCTQCKGYYTGKGVEGRCMTCYERWRQNVYTDPTDTKSWVRRQWQRVDATMHLLSDIEQGVPLSDPKGICPICLLPLDDHRLTESIYPYALAVCKVPPVKRQSSSDTKK
jgi:hypothetical protein